jgi:hypothetical protein
MVPWTVTPVAAISACPDGSVFAVGYENGKVEICDGSMFNCIAVSTRSISAYVFACPALKTHTLHPIQRIPGQQGMELSSLAWARDRTDPHWRLFCGTLGGEILEVCPEELKLVAGTDSYGGAVWSLSNCGTNRKQESS